MDSASTHKSIDLLNRVFLILIIFDIIFCWATAAYDYMFSSVIFLIGISVSRTLSHYQKHEPSTLSIALTLYIIGFYHVVILDNYITCYFILIIAPIVGCFFLEYKINRFILFLSSVLLFPFCNYLVGFTLFANYFFYYGLIPSFISVLYFNNQLEKANREKNQLILDLREKNDEIILYSNMMSHDLKAPLRSISGFSAILQKKMTHLLPEDQKLFSFIIDGVKSMTRLIDDLLMYSKSSLDDFKFDPIALEPLVNEVLESFKYDIVKRKIEINKSNLGKVNGNKESLYLVFQNLISNAIKYQPIDSNHIPKIEIAQTIGNNQNLIVVKDNGIGMSEDQIKDMFKPFKRFHSPKTYEGTGLGMSIVARVIEKHKGKIKVESEYQKGTTFNIILDH